MDAIRFETSPERYKHWRLELSGAETTGVARLVMDVKEDQGLGEYVLKQNSYDLGVDIELADAIQRIRFEHPEVRAIVFTSAKDRIFCSGANIYMLGTSSHAFKVNFCKFTNETRLHLEEASAASGIRSIAALNGVAAGGGYELALACDEIYLQEDGNSAVSLPECPLLAVLPGTGGLTRLVDKRKVRRDHADVFCTVAEGIKGKRAKEWRLVDDVIAKSRFDAATSKRAEELAKASPRAQAKGPGLPLAPLEVQRSIGENVGDRIVSQYRYVTLTIDPKKRVAELEVRGPDHEPPKSGDELRKLGNGWWALRAFRELEDALLDLRFNFLEVGLLVVRSRGDGGKVVAHDKALAALAAQDWLANEIALLQRRVLKRVDVTSRSIFTLVDEGSCFAGSVLELALASDRVYMKDDEDHEDAIRLALSPANFGALPMGNGLTRLQSRFLNEPERAEELRGHEAPMTTQEALKAGLVTIAPDAIDWDDEVRVAIEERAAMSPDAMTGMEASLRYGGPETLETKIFGRLSAWQNWIFTRPNATGQKGALTMYGQPERAEFDWRRA
ncbi:MAG: benzoyl-CoA-dihydrodiol lyase [Deltaproteobacteria bacterium]|nr:benzoyl-CoA-dihydrodiol lyase [Deltaproteobacteria bacterium]